MSTLGDIMSTSGNIQYIGDIMMHEGDIMSRLEDVQYIRRIQLVHQGMFSTSEGYHEHIGKNHEYIEGYHEYIGGCSVH